MAEILEKKLNTRIQLKIDTLARWNQSDVILKKGEVAFATTAAADGLGLTEPVVMMKVGNGVDNFKKLPYVYAKASDVVDAAKSTEKLTKFVADVIDASGLATDGALTALTTRVTNAETAITTLNGDAETAGSVAKQIADAIKALKAEELWDLKNAAAQAFVDAKAYTDEREVEINKYVDQAEADAIAAAATDATTKAGQALTDAKAYADGINTALTTKINDNTSAIATAQADATQALTDAETANDAIAVLNGDAQTDGSVAKAVADALSEAKKDSADKDAVVLAEAQSYTDAEIQTLSTSINSALVDKATNDDLTKEVNRATAAEEALDARLVGVEAFFKTAEGETLDAALDTLKEIQDYITSDGTAAEEMIQDIAANTKAIADEVTRAKAAEGTLAEDIAENAEAIALNAQGITANETAITNIVNGVTTVGKASHATNADEAANAAKLGGVVAADYATKTYADNKANAAQTDAIEAAKEYADGLGVKYDAAGSAAAVEAKLADYYTKTDADGKFQTAEQVETAITAKFTEKNYEGKIASAQEAAEDYADSLAANYATKEQGALADSALQEVKAGDGLKVTNKDTVEIDDAVVFVFNCGDAFNNPIEDPQVQQ